MKLLQWGVLLLIAARCGAQVSCSSSAGLSVAAAHVHSIQEKLKQVPGDDAGTDIPIAARDQLTQLKDALSDVADSALACAESSVDPAELERKIAAPIHANQQEPVAKNGDQSGASSAVYGQNLNVSVRRPSSFPNLLVIDFSVDIECGDDHVLLLYGMENGAWKQQIRWQAPPLKEISDAFGDFFLSAVLPASSGSNAKPAVVVTHGRPWCTSRFSTFDIDVLIPGAEAKSPKVLWHTRRSYSRGDFGPRLKSSENTFDLRVNTSCMDPDAFERRVVYRYRIDDNQQVTRIKPIASNARGFVEEWLSAPWNESQLFTSADAADELKGIYDQFHRLDKVENEFISSTYGPVRACAAAGVFQVQINSTLEKTVPGKPGGESTPLPSRYFHVRDIQNGYLMLSAPDQPDPNCKGPNLMPTTGK